MPSPIRLVRPVPALGREPGLALDRLARLLPAGRPVSVAPNFVPGHVDDGGWHFGPDSRCYLETRAGECPWLGPDEHLVTLPGWGPDWDWPVLLHELGHVATHGSRLWRARWLGARGPHLRRAVLADERAAWSAAGRLWPAVSDRVRLADLRAAWDLSVGRGSAYAAGTGV